MKYLRLYASQDGESHVEEIEAEFSALAYAPPAPALDVSAPVDATRYVTVRFPAGWDSGLHPTPRRQLFVVLSGVLEGETSGGAVMTLKAGDVLLMEDTNGKGHTAKTIGGEDVLALMVHLE
jgi:quercetin dioxygenase-like cupin family protein